MTSKGKTVTISSLVAALAFIGGMAATFDVPVPKPAWDSDIQRLTGEVRGVEQRLAGEVQGVKQRVTEQALERAILSNANTVAPSLL